MNSLFSYMKLSPRWTTAATSLLSGRGVFMRINVAVAVACLSVTGLSMADQAQAAIRKSTNIEAQGLAPALRLFARERDIQVVYRSDLVGGRETGGAVGEFTVEEALTKLLSGTGLTFQYLEDKGITIVPISVDWPQSSASFSDSGKREGKRSLWDRFRLAQAGPSHSPTLGGGLGEEQPLTSLSSNEDGMGKIEEIVVTAQKRKERLQDVPISVSVLSGRDLDRSTGEGVAEALSRVPGVAITAPAQTGGPQISIRGVAAANSLAVGSSPIAYYLDSVPFGFVRSAVTPDASAYDLERVEVLRGPQGTLYGASAQNGVVRVLTEDADLDAMEYKARAGASQTKYGGENYRGDMAVSLPIVAGKLAARAVAGYQDLSGWIDKPNDKGANDAELRNLRLKVNAQPTEELSIGLSGWLSRSDYGAPSAGDDNRGHRSYYDEAIRTDYDSFGLKAGYEFPGFSATSSTSYLDYVLESELDSSLSSTNILTTNLGADVFAQEINLASTRPGPWSWSLGGIYRDAQDELLQVRHTAAGALTAGYQAPAEIHFISKSFAVFGELTRHLLDGRLELTAGLRYFEDDVEQREISRLTNAPSAQLVTSHRKFDAASPRVILTWHPGERMMAYASYAEGFRSGSDQLPTVLFAAPDVAPADSDNLKNYEVGAKGSLLDGRIAFDAAVYYMDWQRVQTPLILVIDGVNQAALVNGMSASGLGFDFGVTVRPVEALTLGLSFSVNDLTQDADVRSGPTLVFNKGERLNLSPKYTAGGSADYVVPIGGSGFRARFSASANYTSERTQRLFNITSLTVNNRPILITGTSLSIESPFRWTASLFVDNMNNEQDAVLGVAATGVPERATRLRPRTIGVQLEYRF